MKPNIGIVNKNRTIQAFQRRFRPELINGIIDRECLLVAKNIGFIIKKNS